MTKSTISKTQNNLNKTTLILSKIAEIVHWLGAGTMLIGTFLSLFQPNWFKDFLIKIITPETTTSCYGFEVTLGTGADLNYGKSAIFALGCAIVLSLMAMVFRNVYLILKTASGKTWFAKGETPFQANIVRMFREIGIFLITISILSLISVTIVSATGGEINHGFNYAFGFMGLAFLCISSFFNYGTKLEKEVDGLV